MVTLGATDYNRTYVELKSAYGTLIVGAKEIIIVLM